MWWPFACGAPISNDVLYEDGVFVAALPDADRLSAPERLRLAVVGDAMLLASAVEAAAASDERTSLLVAAGAGLANAAPDTRSDTVRSWEAVAVAARLGESTVTFYARSTVAEPVDGGDLDWTLDIAPSPDGPWTPFASGTHDPDGSGILSWDLGAQNEALQIVGEAEAVDGAYVSLAPRQVDLVTTALSGATNRVQMSGPDALTWSDAWVVTSDDTPWPGTATATASSLGLGGSATGVVVTDTNDVSFTTCWDAAGNTVWLSGGAEVLAVGDPADCS